MRARAAALEVEAGAVPVEEGPVAEPPIPVEEEAISKRGVDQSLGVEAKKDDVHPHRAAWRPNAVCCSAWVQLAVKHARAAAWNDWLEQMQVAFVLYP
jgi:hypothetical protein